MANLGALEVNGRPEVLTYTHGASAEGSAQKQADIL